MFLSRAARTRFIYLKWETNIYMGHISFHIAH